MIVPKTGLIVFAVDGELIFDLLRLTGEGLEPDGVDAISGHGISRFYRAVVEKFEIIGWKWPFPPGESCKFTINVDPVRFQIEGGSIQSHGVVHINGNNDLGILGEIGIWSNIVEVADRERLGSLLAKDKGAIAAILPLSAVVDILVFDAVPGSH